MATMTFEDFQKTGRNSDDLAAATGNTPDLFSSNSGRLYGKEDVPLYIEALGDRNDGRGARWYTIIERSEIEDTDLETVERALYEFGIEAGYLNMSTFRLELNVDNAAFAGNEAGEIVRILREVADRIDANGPGALTANECERIRDSNGNSCGEYGVQHD